MPDVRVRFAPSPTGDPHIGSIWTALFNFLFARQHHGTFVLRIEDTDRKRLVPGSVERISEALAWYGLAPDEGPQTGGPYAPYVQSQRLSIYRQHVEQLVDAGRAYYCFCTAERLEALRAQQTAARQPTRYDKRCTSITPDEARRRVEAGEPATVRMNLPQRGTIVHTDVVRGRVIFRYDQLDDSVIFKSDGYPTYHLANVVDDHLMCISHVIRAEEWLPSVPKHRFLYEAFGWSPPVFAHLPLLLGPDRTKLSKRHGATAALAFRDQGYLPEAMLNFLVLMGWHPKSDDEVLSLTGAIEQFRIEDVNPAGAMFDRSKLDWLNGVYLRRLGLDELLERVEPFWSIPAGEGRDRAWRLASLGLVQDRLHRLADINAVIGFVFPSRWDAGWQTFDRSTLIPKGGDPAAVAQALRWAADWLRLQPGAWSAVRLRAGMLAAIAAHGSSNTAILWPLRVALTLQRASPDVFDILALLGPAESQRRIERCLT